MRSWLKIMPWSFVVWYAHKNCERFSIDGSLYVRPFIDAPLISVREKFIQPVPNKGMTASEAIKHVRF